MLGNFILNSNLLLTPIYQIVTKPFFTFILQLSSNGLLSLTRPYPNWQAIPFPYGQSLIPILAPYWTDLDLRTANNEAALYHNVYTSDDGLRAQNILKVASDRVKDLQGVSFKGHWGLVSTWSTVSPNLGISNESEVIQY